MMSVSLPLHHKLNISDKQQLTTNIFSYIVVDVTADTTNRMEFTLSTYGFLTN